MNMTKEPELMPEVEEIAKALREPLQKVFPPPAYLRAVGDVGPGRLALARGYARRVLLAVRGGRRNGRR